MAKLYACSASIHVAPSGSGLPSTCSHVGRFVDGVAAGAAAAPGAGRFVESLMLPLSNNSACRLSQSRIDPHRTLPSIPPALYPVLPWLLQVAGESNWQVIRAGSITWSQVSGGWRAGVGYLTMSAVR